MGRRRNSENYKVKAKFQASTYKQSWFLWHKVGLLRLKSDLFFHFSSLTLLYTEIGYKRHRKWRFVLCVRGYHGRIAGTLAKTFGRSSTTLSLIFTDTILYLSQRYKRIIRWHPTVNRARIKKYARVLRKHGGGGHIWGFIDGTFLGVCRPTQEQKKTLVRL